MEDIAYGLQTASLETSVIFQAGITPDVSQIPYRTEILPQNVSVKRSLAVQPILLVVILGPSVHAVYVLNQDLRTVYSQADIPRSLDRPVPELHFK